MTRSEAVAHISLACMIFLLLDTRRLPWFLSQLERHELGSGAKPGAMATQSWVWGMRGAFMILFLQ